MHSKTVLPECQLNIYRCSSVLALGFVFWDIFFPLVDSASVDKFVFYCLHFF